MIYDCFTFFNELDVLDIRLHEMAPLVDKFVLVEAGKTFQGRTKPLYYADNRQRYAAFADKIIHVVIDFPDDLRITAYSRHQSSILWAREHYQRDQIGRGLASARGGDLVIVSDVDEIIAAKRLRAALRARNRHELTVFTMPIYAHFVNRRIPGTTWLRGPRMIEFERFTSGQKMRMIRFRPDRPVTGPWPKRACMHARNIPRRIRTRVINHLVSGIGSRVIEIPDAGWHMTSIGDWDHFRQKMSAYSHAENMDSPSFSDERIYMQSILDTTCEAPIQELPEFIRTNHDLRSRLAWRSPDSPSASA